jgi:hypothetical protein
LRQAANHELVKRVTKKLKKNKDENTSSNKNKLKAYHEASQNKIKLHFFSNYSSVEKNDTKKRSLDLMLDPCL